MTNQHTNTIPESLPLIEQLITFDTTSRNSNLELIDFVYELIKQAGVTSELVYDSDKRKANLYATFGPQDVPGIVLSGHTDVVPVDGQAWDTDPFAVVQKDHQLFARGTADMKSYIAICLSNMQKIQNADLPMPVHFAFSYDEEIGCVGVQGLIKELAKKPVKPAACIIGEPTGMQVVTGHKGKLSHSCTVHGLECHSGMPHKGANAVEAAAEAIAHLKQMARRIRDRGPFDESYDPPYTTVHTGVISGGTALNIVPQECTFEFEFRYLPGDNPQDLMSEIKEYAEQYVLPEMRRVEKNARFEWNFKSAFPGLGTAENNHVTQLTKKLTDIKNTGKVSFGTEGGLFSEIGIPTVVCGPGYIINAHKPNEFVDIEQLNKCETFIGNLIHGLGDGSISV